MQTVAVLAYDRAPTFELSIPFAVFLSAALAGRCRVVTIAGEPGPLRTEHGWALPVDTAPPALGLGDVLMVAGWRDVDELPPPGVVEQVSAAAERGVTVAALCTGAFVLAAAGLLDGRTATTHWAHAHRLAELHPRVRIDADVLYVADGPVLTSAGTSAGIDLCLHIVRTAHGAQIANAVARHMVLGAHREGGQAQYLPRPVQPEPGPDAVLATMDWMLPRLHRPITVAELAQRCHLSPRQYVRRFGEATGTTPYQWLLAQRVTRARELLESTDAGVEDIAHQCGFRDATALRSHFHRRLTTTPTQYRQAFSLRGNSR